jgi:putative transposase
LGNLLEDAYQNNRQVYGSPRLHAELKEQGVHCGRKRVARLMRERGISAKPKRRKLKTTDSHHSNPVALNMLARDFTADAPNTKWVADITGMKTPEGDFYLAAIVDIYSRCAVGWAMSKDRDEQLGTYAATMALERRRSGAGLLHHSDRGSQYTSHGYQMLLKQYGIEISMSGKGDCYDNARDAKVSLEQSRKNVLSVKAIKQERMHGKIFSNISRYSTIVRGNIPL